MRKWFKSRPARIPDETRRQPAINGWFPAWRLDHFFFGLEMSGIPLKITLNPGNSPQSFTLYPVSVGEENGSAYLRDPHYRLDFPLREMIALRVPETSLSPFARSIHLYHRDQRSVILSPVETTSLDIWNLLLSGCFHPLRPNSLS